MSTTRAHPLLRPATKTVVVIVLCRRWVLELLRNSVTLVQELLPLLLHLLHLLLRVPSWLQKASGPALRSLREIRDWQR